MYGNENQPSGFLKTDKDIPPPGTYNISDKLILPTAPKFTFGAGHEILVSEDIPGPGAYDTSYIDKHKGPSAVIAGKLETKYDTDSPGPQAYQIKAITSRGGFSMGSSK